MNKPLMDYSLASSQGADTFEYEFLRSKLLTIIKQESFKETPEPSFKLSSGILSKYYVDCKMTMASPLGRLLTGELIYRLISDSGDLPNAIGGLAMGAIPISIAVSDAAFRAKRDVRYFLVRREPKGHGLKKYVEGIAILPGHDTAIVVDDVVTSGESTITAIKHCREFGLKVERVIVLIDRQESNGRKNIENHGVTFDALFTMDDLKSR